MNDTLVILSNVVYFISFSSLVMVGYLFVFVVVPLLVFYLNFLGIQIPEETLDTLFPYLFLGGYFITVAYSIKHKIQKGQYIKHNHLTKEIAMPFTLIFIGSIGLAAIVYLAMTMKTGAASGLFFLLPGIWMVTFYTIANIKISNYVTINTDNKTG